MRSAAADRRRDPRVPAGLEARREGLPTRPRRHRLRLRDRSRPSTSCITRAKITDVQRAAVWMTGSLNGRSWDQVRLVGYALLILGPLAILMQRWLDRLELGDDAAAALGLQVSRSKLALVLVGVALAALGEAAAGPIVFVAFVAGPIARRLVRSPGACIVPAAFVGALLIVVADLAARRVHGADRASGRHRHRRHRRPVPAVVADAPGPNRSIVIRRFRAGPRPTTVPRRARTTPARTMPARPWPPAIHGCAPTRCGWRTTTT